MRRRWRRRIGWLLVAVVVLTLAALTRVADDDTPLGADSRHGDGAHALTTLLDDHGVHVHAGSDLARVPDGYDGTVVVALATGLSPQGWSRLAARRPAHLVVIVPDRDALSGLAPSITVDDTDDETSLELTPSCGLRPAVSAGALDGSGGLFDVGSGARGMTTCYPSDLGAGGNGYALVRLVTGAADRPGTLDLISTGTPFTNAGLSRSGNAALALNLLGDHRDLLWLTPGSQDDEDVAMGQLLPDWVGPAIEASALLGLVVVAWRGRRLGRVATEPLPVLVRGSETVTGRGRLYRRARARDTAAAHLRAAAIRDLAARLGVRQEHSETLVVRAAAAADRPPPVVGNLLYGPSPTDDLQLLELAIELRDLVAGPDAAVPTSHPTGRGTRTR